MVGRLRARIYVTCGGQAQSTMGGNDDRSLAHKHGCKMGGLRVRLGDTMADRAGANLYVRRVCLV